MDREIETKTERIVELLERENFGGVLLNAQHNFAWITGGGSNGVDLSRENGVASIFVRRDGKRFVFASVIEIERLLAEEVDEDLFDPINYNWQEDKADPGSLFDKVRTVAETGSEIATDIQMFSSTRAIESEMAPLRYELTPHEIGRLRELGRDSSEALSRVIATITVGQSEIEIATEMRRRLGLKNIDSVVTLVAADERIAKYRHPVPTANKWSKTLLLVTCARRGGLIANLSRMVCFGAVPNKLKEKAEAAATVNASLWHSTRPGISGAELYKTAADAYAKVGFANEINRHHQGGAAGYKTREWVAHPKSSEIVKLNQAFAWNPSISRTKVEDTVIVTVDGIENITSSGDAPKIETEIEGQTYRSPGVITIKE